MKRCPIENCNAEIADDVADCGRHVVASDDREAVAQDAEPSPEATSRRRPRERD